MAQDPNDNSLKSKLDTSIIKLMSYYVQPGIEYDEDYVSDLAEGVANTYDEYAKKENDKNKADKALKETVNRFENMYQGVTDIQALAKKLKSASNKFMLQQRVDALKECYFSKGSQSKDSQEKTDKLKKFMEK